MVTYLWFCAVGCSNYFELLKDRNGKPRERGVESLLNAARLDWHNVLNAHVGSVCSQIVVNASGAQVLQEKVFHLFFKVELYV